MYIVLAGVHFRLEESKIVSSLYDGITWKMYLTAKLVQSLNDHQINRMSSLALLYSVGLTSADSIMIISHVRATKDAAITKSVDLCVRRNLHRRL